tara:strand:- start:15229 stop:17229 length:2001 start_codon:yes stop_codon:yes gene_type:complete
MKTFLFLLLFILSHSKVIAQDAAAVAALRAAFTASERGNWDIAERLVRPAGAVAIDLVEWDKLRAGEGQFVDTLDFLVRRPDWPGLPYLRKRSEITITKDDIATDIIEFFKQQPPQTGLGTLRLAQALIQMGQKSEGVLVAQNGWISFDLEPKDEREFLKDFGEHLTNLHEVRLDMLLWRGSTSTASRVLPLVSDGHAKLGKARIALQRNLGGLQARISRIPKELKGDPGLAYDRFKWRLAHKLPKKAIQLLLSQSSDKGRLGQPNKWAAKRLVLARDLIWDKKYQTAYTVAKNHQLTQGRDYAELEWLAGFIALRKLKKPQLALIHFKNHETAVGSAISLGRSYYWQGRAQQVMGQTDDAKLSYIKGANYQTSFYGLLASEAANVPLRPRLAGGSMDLGWQKSAFSKSSVLEAGLLFFKVGQPRRGVRFLTHLAESQSPSDMAKLAGMAEEFRIPYLQLMLGKRAALYDVMLERHFYPLHPLLINGDGISPELGLAIARRESEFFAGAISGVGALGLMQVMPATAKEMAGKLGIPYSRSKMLGDPKYNAKIGVRYLKELIEEFGNSPVHVAAAYNAGPSRARSWTAKLGDPRLSGVDVIDWIEEIPFSETRNYVMRVAESLPNYRVRLTGQPMPLNFLSELKGNYRPPPPFLAPAISIRPVGRTR